MRTTKATCTWYKEKKKKKRQIAGQHSTRRAETQRNPAALTRARQASWAPVHHGAKNLLSSIARSHPPFPFSSFDPRSRVPVTQRAAGIDCCLDPQKCCLPVNHRLALGVATPFRPHLIFKHQTGGARGGEPSHRPHHVGNAPIPCVSITNNWNVHGGGHRAEAGFHLGVAKEARIGQSQRCRHGEAAHEREGEARAGD